MASEFEQLEAHLLVLERLANGYPADSTKRTAILVAANAIHYLEHEKTQAKFREWVESWTQPPTALQVLQAKLCGINLPHELLGESLREVEQLMERLKHKQT